MITKATDTFQFDAIDDVVSDIAKGRIVIVTDDADRENEGDLVIAAEKVTPEAVNFMATHGRGLICVPISNDGALAGADGIPQKTRAAYMHDPEPDRISAEARETGQTRADCEIADRLRRFRSAHVSIGARRDASSRAGEGKDRQEQADAGARA